MNKTKDSSMAIFQFIMIVVGVVVLMRIIAPETLFRMIHAFKGS